MRRTPLMLLCALSIASSALVLVGACGSDEDPGSGDGTESPGEGDETLTHGLTPEQASATLATVGETEITVGEFAEELASKGSFIRTRYNSPERRREFLDQMIRFELLAAEASRRGYDELPEVQRTRKQMMIRRFLEERFGTEGPDAIPDEDVREYYDAHRDEFNTPAQVRASHILFSDRRAAERVLRQLQEAPSDLRLYRRLAEEHNTDSDTRDRFGDLRFFSRPDERTSNEPEVIAEVANAAFAIERIGGLAPTVIESERGFHVIKLTGRRAAMHRSLEEASRPIRNRLQRERREAGIQALIDELRAESDVEEDLSVLDDIQIDIPENPVQEATHPAHELGGGPSGRVPARPTVGPLR